MNRRVDGVGRPKFDFHSGAAASRATTRRSRARAARAATSSSTSGTCSATSRRCRRRRRSAASRSRSSTAAPRVRRVQDLCCLPRCDGRGDGVPVGWVTPPHAVDRESSSTFASIPPPLIVYRAGHDGHHGPPLRVDGPGLGPLSERHRGLPAVRGQCHGPVLERLHAHVDGLDRSLIGAREVIARWRRGAALSPC